MDRDQLLRITKQRIILNGRVLGAFVILCLIFDCAVSVYLYQNPHEDRPVSIFLFLGILGTLALIYKYAAEGVPRTCRFYRIISERPRDIAWIYVHSLHVVSVHTPPAQSVCLGLTSGWLAFLSVDRGEVRDIVSGVANLAPGATVGYSEEIRKQFLSNPASLRTG
jgi:hypothetical protein